MLQTPPLATVQLEAHLAEQQLRKRIHTNAKTRTPKNKSNDGKSGESHTTVSLIQMLHRALKREQLHKKRVNDLEELIKKIIQDNECLVRYVDSLRSEITRLRLRQSSSTQKSYAESCNSNISSNNFESESSFSDKGQHYEASNPGSSKQDPSEDHLTIKRMHQHMLSLENVVNTYKEKLNQMELTMQCQDSANQSDPDEFWFENEEFNEYRNINALPIERDCDKSSDVGSRLSRNRQQMEPMPENVPQAHTRKTRGKEQLPSRTYHAGDIDDRKKLFSKINKLDNSSKCRHGEKDRLSKSCHSKMPRSPKGRTHRNKEHFEFELPKDFPIHVSHKSKPKEQILIQPYRQDPSTSVLQYPSFSKQEIGDPSSPTSIVKETITHENRRRRKRHDEHKHLTNLLNPSSPNRHEREEHTNPPIFPNPSSPTRHQHDQHRNLTISPNSLSPTRHQHEQHRNPPILPSPLSPNRHQHEQHGNPPILQSASLPTRHQHEQHGHPPILQTASLPTRHQHEQHGNKPILPNPSSPTRHRNEKHGNPPILPNPSSPTRHRHEQHGLPSPSSPTRHRHEQHRIPPILPSPLLPTRHQNEQFRTLPILPNLSLATRQQYEQLRTLPILPNHSTASSAYPRSAADRLARSCHATIFQPQESNTNLEDDLFRDLRRNDRLSKTCHDMMPKAPVRHNRPEQDYQYQYSDSNKDNVPTEQMSASSPDDAGREQLRMYINMSRIVPDNIKQSRLGRIFSKRVQKPQNQIQNHSISESCLCSLRKSSTCAYCKLRSRRQSEISAIIASQEKLHNVTLRPNPHEDHKISIETVSSDTEDVNLGANPANSFERETILEQRTDSLVNSRDSRVPPSGKVCSVVINSSSASCRTEASSSESNETSSVVRLHRSIKVSCFSEDEEISAEGKCDKIDKTEKRASLSTASNSTFECYAVEVNEASPEEEESSFDVGSVKKKGKYPTRSIDEVLSCSGEHSSCIVGDDDNSEAAVCNRDEENPKKKSSAFGRNSNRTTKNQKRNF